MPNSMHDQAESEDPLQDVSQTYVYVDDMHLHNFILYTRKSTLTITEVKVDRKVYWLWNYSIVLSENDLAPNDVILCSRETLLVISLLEDGYGRMCGDGIYKMTVNTKKIFAGCIGDGNEEKWHVPLLNYNLQPSQSLGESLVEIQSQHGKRKRLSPSCCDTVEEGPSVSRAAKQRKKVHAMPKAACGNKVKPRHEAAKAVRGLELQQKKQSSALGKKKKHTPWRITAQVPKQTPAENKSSKISLKTRPKTIVKRLKAAKLAQSPAGANGRKRGKRKANDSIISQIRSSAGTKKTKLLELIKLPSGIMRVEACSPEPKDSITHIRTSAGQCVESMDVDPIKAELMELIKLPSGIMRVEACSPEPVESISQIWTSAGWWCVESIDDESKLLELIKLPSGIMRVEACSPEPMDSITQIRTSAGHCFVSMDDEPKKRKIMELIKLPSGIMLVETCSP